MYVVPLQRHDLPSCDWRIVAPVRSVFEIEWHLDGFETLVMEPLAHRRQELVEVHRSVVHVLVLHCAVRHASQTVWNENYCKALHVRT